jgi:hypothetical protein
MTSFSGSRLDPLVLRLFIEIMGPWPVGCIVILDSNRLAMTKAVRLNGSPYPLAVQLEKDTDGTLKKGQIIDLSQCDENQNPRNRILSCVSPVTYGIQPTDYLF